MKHYFKCWEKYAVMSGRAGRREYWQFFLVNIIINAALTLLANRGISGMGMISLIYSLAVLLPALSVGVRRFHDLGRSGMSFAVYVVPIIVCIVAMPVLEWATKPSTGLLSKQDLGIVLAIVVIFLPFILGIMLLCVLARRGQPEANRYGEPPVE